ncbi:hypothetical protein, partial [Nocardia amamiensis]|uniref:hypothetical protein n=1 Tax=Nocardia amamiensis TaxID=404578 RepID=UPI001C3F6094
EAAAAASGAARAPGPETGAWVSAEGAARVASSTPRPPGPEGYLPSEGTGRAGPASTPGQVDRFRALD